MRKIFIFAILSAAPLIAQVSNPSILSVTSAPSGACTSGLPNQQVVTTGVQYSCQNGTWGAIGSGAGAGITPVIKGSYTFYIAGGTTYARNNVTGVIDYSNADAGIFHVSGTTAIATITAPAACTASGYGCQITIIPDGAFTTTNAGNIAIASTAVVSKALVMAYDPGASKWYPSY